MLTMRAALFATVVLPLAAPALAGEEVLYRPAADWVEPAVLPPASEAPGDFVRLLSEQVLLEGGVVSHYRDTALQISSPEMLANAGTITMQWQPDKGDLVVHRLEIMRAGKPIDLLAGGTRFTVLRREQGLEKRALDGQLSATVAVPGLQVGDTLRLAATTTMREQALGNEMQWRGAVPLDPAPIHSGSVKLIWPAASPMRFAVRGLDTAVQPVTRNGRSFVSVPLPAPKRGEMPGDAPPRFGMPPMLQVTTFADWADVSATMAPHFKTEGTIPTGSPLAGVVRQIAAQASDPLPRAALALQRVQDDIAYLANGMDGGNYLPQSPEETWKTRYGDCKAKSLLLAAMLRELGVDAEVVVVATQGGDALPELLPMPGQFDHMIVRASIGGRGYWLDGTSSGTRLANIDAVPRFYHALPLRPGGADLLPMPMRPQTVPDRDLQITVDQTAGLELPALYTARLTFSGPTAGMLRTLGKMEDSAQRRDALRNVVTSTLGDVMTLKPTVTFDERAGTATVVSRGVITPEWDWSERRFELTPPFQPAADIAFNGNRARPAWRTIPVNLNGPLFFRSQVEWLLPGKGSGFTLRNGEPLSALIGGTAVRGQAGLTGGKFSFRQDMQSTQWELPADQLGEAKRTLAQHLRRLPVMVAPADAKRVWEYGSSAKSALAPVEQFYLALLDEVSADEANTVLQNRAYVRSRIGDYTGALRDLDVVAKRAPDSWTYATRASVREELGDLAGALADFERQEEMDAKGDTFQQRVELLGRLKRHAEAARLADEYAGFAEKPEDAEYLRAIAMGYAGQRAEGLEVLRGVVDDDKSEANRLNSLCWYAATWNLVDEDVLATCTRAVERSQDSAAVRDSRALALYRLGRLPEALAEYGRVLADAPEQHDSRFMRGIVRLAMGDKAGRGDVDAALAAKPSIRARYGDWGLTAPK